MTEQDHCIVLLRKRCLDLHKMHKAEVPQLIHTNFHLVHSNLALRQSSSVYSRRHPTYRSRRQSCLPQGRPNSLKTERLKYIEKCQIQRGVCKKTGGRLSRKQQQHKLKALKFQRNRFFKYKKRSLKTNSEKKKKKSFPSIVESYFYDFLDERVEFQTICDFLNFEPSQIFFKNLIILVRIVFELKFEMLLKIVTKASDMYSRCEAALSKHQDQVDDVEELFDFLTLKKKCQITSTSFFNRHWQLT